jgi:hypothetical protein
MVWGIFLPGEGGRDCVEIVSTYGMYHMVCKHFAGGCAGSTLLISGIWCAYFDHVDLFW